MSLNIVLLGPPGAGKGTYARILSQKYGIPTISVGDLFRAAIKEENELGKKVKAYVSSGDLVPDEIVVDVVKNRLIRDQKFGMARKSPGHCHSLGLATGELTWFSSEITLHL